VIFHLAEEEKQGPRPPADFARVSRTVFGYEVPLAMANRIERLLPGPLKPLASARFAKFCAVGASGVLVNMGCLALFAELLGAQANVAAALSIEISINTNFLINELWTFRDRRSGPGSTGHRWLRFHAVSFIGAALQWSVFVAGNALVAWSAGRAPGLVSAIADPPDVGAWMYLSQLVGIGIATLWNFMANFFWTWKHGTGGSEHE
jgi:dolichol-phosphate mannosyltransferase